MNGHGVGHGVVHGVVHGGARGVVHEVYDASYRRLVVQMYAFCGDQAEAEDAVQDAFVKAIGSARSFERLDNPEAWLRTVAMNTLRNRWRRAKVLRGLTPKLPGVGHVVELSPDRVALVAALGRLPVDLRAVVVLHHIADLPVAEVAHTLQIPEGTAKTRLVKARAMLAALLSDHEEASNA